MSLVRIFLLLFPIFISAQSINVALIAHHGINQIEKDWMNTITYLNQKIPEHHFKLVPFLATQFSELKKDVKDGKIDFIISQPLIYVELELTAGASKMLTLVRENNITQFGSVIIASKSSNIINISQITADSRIAAVAPLGFGGWLIGYNELRDHHIPINKKDVDFLGTHENVVKAVMSNKAEIGIIRTGVLEKLQSEKKINLKNITIIHQQLHKNFPLLCSSELYPEWAFARTKHIDNDIAKKVVLALLALPENSDITKNSDYFQYHWTAPYSYQKVKELIKRLEIGYYENLKSEILNKWIEQHEEIIFFILLLIVTIFFLSFIREYITNKRLLQEQKTKDALLKQVEYQAYHDKLTKLFNRTYLEKIISIEKSFSIIMLDINNFSYINMSYGFEIGDKLLIKVANVLKGFNAQSTYHLSSDEFALLFDEKVNFKEKIKQIQDYFDSNTIQIETLSFHISFSYGAAYDRDKIILNGALALKKSKEYGNRLYVFDEKIDNIDYAKRESFLSMHNLLCEALEEDRIVPYFQGIRNNKTKRIRKFEVLARIEHDGKQISPNQFLKTAQLSGFLPNITKVMIDKSFKIMAQNDYSFSINITEDDLSRDYLFSYLQEKSKQYGIKPQRVILEILEGVSAIGQKNNIRQLEQFKREGYSLAIDDFGVEYSNFERTLELHIDFIKIDAKYIKDMDVNPRSYNVAKSIAFFAKQSNIPCIAEFVHNEAIQKIVEELEIDYSQGYYFSEPAKIPM